MKIFKPIFAIFSVLAAVILVACSNANSSSTSSSSSTSGATARTLEEIKESGTVKIGVFSDKKPFGYVNANGEYQGYDVYLGNRLAKELGVVIIVPFFEKRMAGIYHNSAYIIDTDGSEAGLYRKMHIPDDPAFYEKFYFTPGDLGFKNNPTKKGNIGTLICWDQWYPEAARITALKGAEVLFYPTAIGWHPLEKEQYGENQHGAWINVMKGHAVANGVYVAAANRIGLEQYIEGTAGIQFWGSSFIAGPQGEILAQASHDKEEILIAEVDLDLQENVRQNWPFFRDRRIDAFGDITKRAID